MSNKRRIKPSPLFKRLIENNRNYDIRIENSKQAKRHEVQGKRNI